MDENGAKKNPSDNNKEVIKDDQNKEVTKVPENYLVSKDGTETLVKAIHDVVSSPHVRQVLFNVINDVFIPVKEKEDSPK